MSDNNSSSSAPSLSQYFNTNTEDENNQIESSESEIDNILVNLKLTDHKNEPQVCRLFSDDETTKPKDPTAAFFDIISPSPSTGEGGLITDLGMKPTNVNILIFKFSFINENKFTINKTCLF